MPHVRVLPIRQGKVDACRDFIAQLLNAQRAAFGVSQRAEGISEEHFFIQSDPRGDYLIVYNDGDPVSRDRVRQERQQSREPFEVWYKATFRDVHGIDLDHPPVGSRVEHIGSWRDDERLSP